MEQSRGWADVGRSLWEDGSVAPGAWRTLVDVNAGYLRISSLAALAAATGYAAPDEAAGRCALLLEAAADTWNRAYFLALRSDAPAGTMPGVTCR
ncbi:MAG: hypothetical protein FJ087_02280 [Deltaproteobacteria bacterium]|nr:hypothetical protein [Deltaproteobacteria bacterium]